MYTNGTAKISESGVLEEKLQFNYIIYCCHTLSHFFISTHSVF